MKLIIDIGNTLTKAAVFEKKQLLETYTISAFTIDFVHEIISKNKNISSVIISSVVKKIPTNIINFLKKEYCFIELSSETKLPVNNFYKSPETLGKDRIAGIVAAYSLHKEENVLVIDAGTCITYDFISSKKEYFGGSISPGMNMRFKALHTFTKKLPLVSLTNFNELIGTDTNKSILSGVINGITAEIDAMIEKFKEKYSSLTIIICGGDAQFLVSRLKNSIFAVPELVLIGLNEILDYNE